MRAPEKRNPGWRAGASGTFASGQRFHVDHASAEPLLQRLEGVQKSGNGWRAKCPACGGRSRKLSIAEREGRVLLHCFGGCKAIEVLEAVGLGWADIMPPRHWPESPEERRQARRAIREAGWASALSVLSMEATIVHIAAAKLLRDEPLDWNDYCRLVKAEERIGNARAALVEDRR
ncbi:DNA primase [Pseudoxanthomonas taiwanensis]|uniref:DNA primase n=1 Tax=Pseudoxanthomonas taiwanensis TaxID=176598 RepID=A0A921P3Y5_9GAMM|nr:DNA primase [Pseudoxanthomonas taiwanensis]KAF1690192.1 DNA primase [Pseudoxanthomonas taiwanensis]